MQRSYGRNRPGLVQPKRGDGGEVGEEVREVTGEEGRLYGALYVIEKKNNLTFALSVISFGGC